MGTFFVPHLIILNKNPISEELLGPALPTLLGTYHSWAQWLLWPQCWSAPRRCEQRGDVPVNRVRNECKWIPHPPSSQGSHFLPFFVPLPVLREKRWISALVLTSCLSDLERSVCGKAWHCANDAELESKRGWKGGRCDLGLLWLPQFFSYCVLPGSLGTWDCLELDQGHGFLFPTGPFCLRR